MRRAECKWRTRDEKRKIVEKERRLEPTEGRPRVFAERWSEEIYTETIDLSGLS